MCEMRAVGVLFLICIATFLPPTSADGTCEKFQNYAWARSIVRVKTCFMESTAINSKGFSITSDRDVIVKAFYAGENKKVEHLPNNLGGKFPNLLRLYAYDCSIKEISKDNFEGLGKLQHLILFGNQIEMIDDDTFEHIASVEEVDLSGNKIKKINGRAFVSLQKLTGVQLLSNECIHEMFYDAAGIAEMPRIVTEKCGFTDSAEPSSTKIVRPEADLMTQSQN